MQRNGILSILGLAVMLAALAPVPNVLAANTTSQSIMVFNLYSALFRKDDV